MIYSRSWAKHTLAALEYDQEVIGALAWIIAPGPVWPHSSSYEGDMTGWAFVLNHGQRLLPAAREFFAVVHTQR